MLPSLLFKIDIDGWRKVGGEFTKISRKNCCVLFSCIATLYTIHYSKILVDKTIKINYYTSPMMINYTIPSVD